MKLHTIVYITVNVAVELVSSPTFHSGVQNYPAFNSMCQFDTTFDVKLWSNMAYILERYSWHHTLRIVSHVFGSKEI